MSSRWFWGLLVLFLVGGIGAGILYRRYKVLLIGQQEEQTEKGLVTRVDSVPGSPIFKRIGLENKGVEYELRGNFSGKLLDRGGLLEGTFVIQGDPLEDKGLQIEP